MFASQAQSRLMRAIAASETLGKKLGIKKSVAEDFIAAGHGQKVGKLPDHVRPKNGSS